MKCAYHHASARELNLPRRNSLITDLLQNTLYANSISGRTGHYNRSELSYKEVVLKEPEVHNMENEKSLVTGIIQVAATWAPVCRLSPTNCLSLK